MKLPMASEEVVTAKVVPGAAAAVPLVVAQPEAALLVLVLPYIQVPLVTIVDINPLRNNR